MQKRAFEKAFATCSRVRNSQDSEFRVTGGTRNLGAALARKIEKIEKAQAKERMVEADKQTGRGHKKGCADSAPPLAPEPRTREKVAEATGMSRDTLKKAQAVVEAATAEPEKYGDLPKQMDRTAPMMGRKRK